MKTDLDRATSELSVLRGIANQCPDAAVRIQLQGKINVIERHVKLALMSGVEPLTELGRNV